MRSGMIYLSLLAFAFGFTVRTAQADCSAATSSYNLVIRDISTRLLDYAQCLNTSLGRKDCASEFRQLRAAQSDFEIAVDSYRFECRQ